MIKFPKRPIPNASIFLIFTIVFLTHLSGTSSALPTLVVAQPAKHLLDDHWTAWWIAHPTESAVDYGIFHFRKDIIIESLPSVFVVNLSADNRYKFFVNGTEVCFGPARGDLAHWYFETIDIAPFLKAGKNTLAAVVWNFSLHRPWAQLSLQTAFVLQGNSSLEEIANTNSSWKVIRNLAYKPITNFSHLQTFIVVGPGDHVDADSYPWGWKDADYNTEKWSNARQIVNPKPRGIGTDIDWVMTPRNIPLMENKTERLFTLRRSQGSVSDAGGIIAGNTVTIPANSKVSLLFDHGHLTKGYPSLSVSDGAGSTIRLTYAEALYSALDDHPDLNVRKMHRDKVDGMEIRGTFDEFLPDGGSRRTFSPLWYRTFRYLQMEISTAQEPLQIHDLYNIYSAYPFEENASFETAEPLFDKIWEVGWRTSRMCAQETYYDCPYYEQLQYAGDTRIQALVSLYVSGDDRLMRKALHMFDVSRIHEGITYSRYPTFGPQFIPPYSLVWINMVHDFMMHRDDPEFVRGFIPGITSIVEWHSRYIDTETGMLGKVPYWNFVDWADEWPWDTNLRIGGVPSGGMDGNSSILTLQFAYTLKEAAALMAFAGKHSLAEEYYSMAQSLNTAVMENTWSTEKKLIADTPNKTVFSQHANIMAILSGALENEVAADVMEKILNDTTLIQATMYFRFYLFLAMQQTGHMHLLSDQLYQWKDMLDLGLTTFAEKPEPTRSDCHAWSASPLYFFLSAMAGIKPAEPGFKSVVIAPEPGALKGFNAVVPHPNGMISVHALKLDTPAHSDFSITLPETINGTFVWNGTVYNLTAGQNVIRIR